MWLWCGPTAEAAEPLYVEEERADEVAAAVEALWPGDHLVVQPRPESVDAGFVWDGAHLLRVADGRVTWGDAPDPETAVVLARAWSRAPPPPPEAPPEPPEIARSAPPPPTRQRRSAPLVTAGALDALGQAAVGAVVGVGVVYPAVDLRVVVSATNQVTGSWSGPLTIDAISAWPIGFDRSGPGPRGGPLALVGGGLSAVVPGVASASTDLVVGLGADAWGSPRVGARAAISYRVGQLGSATTAALEVMWAARPKDSTPTAQPFGEP